MKDKLKLNPVRLLFGTSIALASWFSNKPDFISYDTWYLSCVVVSATGVLIVAWSFDIKI